VCVDSDGCIVLVNTEAEHLFGYERGELVGRAVECLVPEPSRPAHSGHRVAYFANPTPRSRSAGQLKARRKDGSEFWVEIAVSSLESADGLLACASVFDMTTDRQTEAVEGRDQQLQADVEGSPEAMVAVDSGGTIRMVSRQGEAMFGYPHDELVGEDLATLVPDLVKPIHSLDEPDYFADPSGPDVGRGVELTATRKDGTELPVEITLSSLETDNGGLVSAAVRDVTDRKATEAEQTRLETELQQAQADAERAGLEAQLHQAHRLESVGQLAGGIAHDFNNLLAGIMNYAALVAAGLNDLLARHGIETDEAAVTLTQDVDEITDVAKRAAQLTHQLLIFSHREVVNPEVLDLNVIVVDMEKLMRRTIGEGVDLRTELDPSLPRTRADRGQLEQIIMNLAVNARDAMSGSGRLRIETASFEADAAYGFEHGIDPGPYVRLTISDDGQGMHPEVVRRAFEPFFTTKLKGEGSGLGLATVHGIVTHAGGDVVIFSEPGTGTSVIVDLPITDDDPVPDRAAPGERSLSGQGETILLVEDERIVREPARRLLARRGYTVLAASNADEALRIARDHQGEIHLLLTDVIMPGRSGKELAGDLADLREGIKVLYMSGYSHDLIVHEGVLEEGISLIEKPFAPDALLRKVRDGLDHG
jgi:hypothetical protein